MSKTIVIRVIRVVRVGRVGRVGLCCGASTFVASVTLRCGTATDVARENCYKSWKGWKR